MKSKRVKLNNTYKFIVPALIALAVSCTVDPNRPHSEELKHDKPGIQFMDDMYHSPSIETYGYNTNYADNMGSRHPVAGTIPRGFMPYPYPNTNEGYAMAGDSLKNPISLTPSILAEGQDLYIKFCVHCHGKEGQGDGTVIVNTDGKYPPPPSYSTGVSSGGGDMKDLPEGKMFHTITFGRNMMGSHASQLNATERWKIIHYVQTLQKAGNDTGGEEAEGEAPIAPAPIAIGDYRDGAEGEQSTTENE